jgi:hypothetical protein
MMTQSDIVEWLDRFVASALARDLEGHMAMISRQVLVFGVPGFDSLEYDDWYRQCEHEFPQGLLRDLRYEGVRLRLSTDDRVLFKALEKTVTRDGARIDQGVEIMLQLEGPDWRLKQLRLLPEDEMRHDGLM